MKIEDYTKYYIQNSDHYLIPKDIFKELFNEMVNWKEENEQLKDNWNDLKKYAKEIISTDNELYGTDLLDKMQELRGNDINE